MTFSDFLNSLTNEIIPIIVTALAGVVTWIIAKIKTKVSESTNLKTEKTIAESVVKCVEQIYTDLTGEEKFSTAVTKMQEVLESKDITITETEIQILIEEAVYNLNHNWFE